jgi:hypothetical protein
VGEVVPDSSGVYGSGRDRDQVLDRAADEVGPIITEHRLGHAVDRPYHPRSVDDHNAVRHRFQQLVDRNSDADDVVRYGLYRDPAAADWSAVPFGSWSYYLGHPAPTLCFQYMRQDMLGGIGGDPLSTTCYSHMTVFGDPTYPRPLSAWASPRMSRKYGQGTVLSW